MNIVVWFSCGAASAMAAKLAIEKYPRDNIEVVYNPVIEEHQDNIRFLHDVENWIGKTIVIHGNPKYTSNSANDVWKNKKFMSSPYGAPCTVELKKRARQDYESKHHIDYHVLGFTYEEKDRHERFILTERSNVLPILIDAKLTKKDCIKIISENIKLPEVYSLGYPNANCIGCVKASSPTYWNLVRKTHPQVFDERSKLSREIGSKLVVVKGKRIFLDELDPNITARKLKSYSIDCGIFCEEKPLKDKKKAENKQQILDRALEIALEAYRRGEFVPQHLLKDVLKVIGE